MTLAKELDELTPGLVARRAQRDMRAALAAFGHCLRLARLHRRLGQHADVCMYVQGALAWRQAYKLARRWRQERGGSPSARTLRKRAAGVAI